MANRLTRNTVAQSLDPISRAAPSHHLTRHGAKADSIGSLRVWPWYGEQLSKCVAHLPTEPFGARFIKVMHITK